MIDMQNIQTSFEKYRSQYDKLPVFFEGNSRVLKQTSTPQHLISRLKPTVFSLEANGPVVVPGVDIPRANINALLCSWLHRNNIKTSTIHTQDGYILTHKEIVPPIEVVVKSALVGSPKHIYKKMNEVPTRFGSNLEHGQIHEPYVRFDWRNPLPHQDMCLPEGLADHFIDVQQARHTALNAFKLLKTHLNKVDLDLIDICFFMNTAGDTICGEISTDNTNITYIGSNPDIKMVFASRDKQQALKKAEVVFKMLTSIN